MKIIIPISFFTTVLVHFGIVYKLDFILTPAMNWLGLPASAALVLVVGAFTGIYGTVAALSAMPFSMDHMILISIFTLISHNLIQESMVQGKSGINPVFAAMFRLFMSFIVTFVCAKIMGVTPGESTGSNGALLSEPTQTFGAMLQGWGWDTLKLIILIMCIIMPLMVALEIAKVLDFISVVTRLIKPLVKGMGLNPSTGMLWITAMVFGLSYGSAVIVEETKEKEFEKQDLTKLHLSIGINHAMIEDPSLFLPLGLPVFWLWIPRIVAAFIAVWLYKGAVLLRRSYAQ